MSRYKSGDTVAFVNKFSRCGHVVSVDGNKGYRINTGKDIIYGYPNELVLISDNAPIRPMVAINKIDKACENMPEYTSGFRQSLVAFIQEGTQPAKLFVNYILEVSQEVVKDCIKAISNIKIDFSPTFNVNIEEIKFNISFQLFSWQLA